MSREVENTPNPKSRSKLDAFLIVRDGHKWRDVFRLNPGEVMTVGRAPSNRIVLRDEICSRNHCEVFLEESRWILRDLGSRNGTLVNGRRISGEWPLEEGQRIQIGSFELGFTYDLSRPFPAVEEQDIYDSNTAIVGELSLLNRSGSRSEPEILHRKRRSRFLPSSTADSSSTDRTSQDLVRLYQLALTMGAARDAHQLADVALDALFAGTNADLGAILLFPQGREVDGDTKPTDLRVVACRTSGEFPYQRVSDYLGAVVLKEREAVLARDVADDSRLASRDSLGEIHAKSVICAPVRLGEKVFGLVHLYSINPDAPLEPDDLEFTLAAADQAAVALENLNVKELLADGLARARNENQTLRRQLAIESELVGESASMLQLRETIGRIAPTDATALIRGESGVGKELVARAIHFSSNRRNGPFVCMNCAALSESLLESELFGHEKGSFTGATDRKLGKFEQANHGTLFLDEVGEMSLAIQAKFLRVLEGHAFERVGGGTAIHVDVRVVAATNRDLETAVSEGKFRKDLYFRLYVVEIFVDPLRERRSDIPILANFFVERFSSKTGRPVKGFSREALEALVDYDWPGNVRELQNTVERAAILCSEDVIQAKDIQLSTLGMPEPRSSSSSGAGSFREISLEMLEQEHILATLDRTNWNKSQAAQILGIERSTLDRKLKRYRVSRPKN